MYVKVRVFPGVKKEKLVEIGAHRYEITVREPAERNLANERVRQLLATVYAVDIKAVRIISGHQSPSKILDVRL